MFPKSRKCELTVFDFPTVRFTNYGFLAETTNITSCARRGLVDCAVAQTNDLADCSLNVNEALIDQTGIFSVDDNFDENISFIFSANGANIALDNIKIDSQRNMSSDNAVSAQRRLSSDSDIHVMFGAMDGAVLIVDSVAADGVDIGFNADNCTVMANDVLTNNSSMISRLIIECDAFQVDDDFNVEYTMDSAVTDYVDHFSAIKIGIYPKSTSYYPGESIGFNYSVSDRLGNVIEDETVQSTTIILSGGSFSGSLWIDENGDCLLCDEVW